jgi:cell division protein ZapA
MPEIDVTIGGRSFPVACQPGEESFLLAAAAILDAEAAPIVGQLGRMPETRMLLMAGLLVADRLAGAEEELRRLKSAPPAAPEPPAPVALDGLAALAERAEALAAAAEAAAQDAPQG